MELKEKIKNKKAKLGIIGLGHVGLPLAVTFAEGDYYVIGIDKNKEKISQIRKCKSYTPDVSNEQLEKLFKRNIFLVSDDFSYLKETDIFFFCLPTGLKNNKKKPDLSAIFDAIKEANKYLSPGKLVIIESTVYPGAIRNEILPRLEKSGIRAGKDFNFVYSPERIDPANRKYTIKNIPKIVAGLTEKCAELASLLYSRVIKEIYVASSIEVAEMAKLMENVFRSINIAYAFEIAKLCHGLGIDVWEVIRAASTKPFGFMPFYPSCGVGGPCIAIDPYFLSWKAAQVGIKTSLIDLAANINKNQPRYIFLRLRKLIKENLGKQLKGTNVLLLGVAYKEGVGDTRESPAIKLMKFLKDAGAEVYYHDPLVPVLKWSNKKEIYSLPLTEKNLNAYSIDCAIVLNKQDGLDYSMVVEKIPLIFDCKNVLRDFQDKKNVHTL